MKIYMERKVCEFFDKVKKMKGDVKPEDIVLATAIARLYYNVDKFTIVKAIWSKDPSLIPTSPVCITRNP
jgi:hypothetical protein